MLFADDGYFLHDAPWRTVWGPGANLTHGSHGCINVPKAAMATLFGWATAGTTVIVE
jgi:lipoprotein-anchoring transpeptidase ErfK/SrfK